MNFRNCLPAVLLLLVFELSIFAQNDWTILKEKNGIKISSRFSPTSPFNDIRVELDLYGNIDQLTADRKSVKRYELRVKLEQYACKILQ